MPFVLDNSVVIGWCFQNQATAYTDRVLDLLADETAHAPGLWVLEFSNILRKTMKAGKLDEARAMELIETISALPLSIDYTPSTIANNLELANKYGLSSYDAAYLELAMRLKLPIAARDGAFERRSYLPQTMSASTSALAGAMVTP